MRGTRKRDAISSKQLRLRSCLPPPLPLFPFWRAHTRRGAAAAGRRERLVTLINAATSDRNLDWRN